MHLVDAAFALMSTLNASHDRRRADHVTDAEFPHVTRRWPRFSDAPLKPRHPWASMELAVRF